MQTVLPLLLLLLLLAPLQPVDLHGLGAPGPPHVSRVVGQSHGCEMTTCRAKVARSLHGVGPSLPHAVPAPLGGLWADRGMEAREGEGLARGDRGGLCALSLACPPPHVSEQSPTLGIRLLAATLSLPRCVAWDTALPSLGPGFPDG